MHIKIPAQKLTQVLCIYKLSNTGDIGPTISASKHI